MLVSLGFGTFGVIMLAISVNIYMAVIALVIIGFGLDSCLAITVYYVNEMV